MPLVTNRDSSNEMTFKLRKNGLNDGGAMSSSIESLEAGSRARNDDQDARVVVGYAQEMRGEVRVKGRGSLRDVRSSCGSEN